VLLAHQSRLLGQRRSFNNVVRLVHLYRVVAFGEDGRVLSATFSKAFRVIRIF
jgi:hypothetical protein